MKELSTCKAIDEITKKYDWINSRLRARNHGSVTENKEANRDNMWRIIYPKSMKKQWPGAD